MDYVTAFGKLRPAIEKVNREKLEGDFAIQVTMTDDDCHGIFYISYFDGLLGVEPFDYVDNTAAITLTKLSLNNLIAGRSKAEKLIENGKLQVTGNEDVVKMFFNAMPEKKTTKKTPDKAKNTKSKIEKK